MDLTWWIGKGTELVVVPLLVAWLGAWSWPKLAAWGVGKSKQWRDRRTTLIHAFAHDEHAQLVALALSVETRRGAPYMLITGIIEALGALGQLQSHSYLAVAVFAFAAAAFLARAIVQWDRGWKLSLLARQAAILRHPCLEAVDPEAADLVRLHGRQLPPAE